MVADVQTHGVADSGLLVLMIEGDIPAWAVLTGAGALNMAGTVAAMPAARAIATISGGKCIAFSQRLIETGEWHKFGGMTFLMQADEAERRWRDLHRSTPPQTGRDVTSGSAALPIPLGGPFAAFTLALPLEVHNFAAMAVRRLDSFAQSGQAFRGQAVYVACTAKRGADVVYRLAWLMSVGGNGTNTCTVEFANPDANPRRRGGVFLRTCFVPLIAQRDAERPDPTRQAA